MNGKTGIMAERFKNPSPCPPSLKGKGERSKYA